MFPVKIAQASRFAEADQRKMPHRRHRPAFGEANAAMPCRPVGQPRPRELRTPAEPPRQRCEGELEDAARPALGADVVDFLKTSKPPMTHVVLTGRNAKEELIEIADLVTEMTLVKHPFRSGIKAQPGVEF